MPSNKKKTRFSDYFDLGKTQAELDFVDIPIETDIPLYVDPYALHISSQDWLRECGNAVVDYFELLVASLRKEDKQSVLQLLDNFHEVNQTHLGQSSGRPSGRGWGRKQAAQLHEVLESSAAFRSGELKDLGDYEMFIPGIGPDKISDLTTNIIKSELLIYTADQCALYGIPVEEVNPGKIWDTGSQSFISRYAHLPICNEKPIILVPKTAVRTRLVPDHDKFYSRFVLDYLEAELINANHALVKVLKNGKRKVVRKELRQKYPGTRQALYDFSKKHPEVLQKYKNSLPINTTPISDADIEYQQKAPRSTSINELGAQLDTIKPGKKDADHYNSTILGLLQVIFQPSLCNPKKEQPINDGRKRIDIRFDNAASSGFFSHLVNMHRVFAPYVAVECKNYSTDPENPELDQLQGRFGRKRGNFGLLVCRTVDKPELMLKRCRDIVNNSDQVVIVLEDEDIKAMLSLRALKGLTGVDDYMAEKLRAILM